MAKIEEDRVRTESGSEAMVQPIEIFRMVEVEPIAGDRLVVHFQSFKKDGIGLQLHLHNAALEKIGIQSHNCCSDLPAGSRGLFMPELDWQSPDVIRLRERIFNPDLNNLENESELWGELERDADKIRDKAEEYIRQNGIKTVDVYNLFSMPFHPAATWAFYTLARDNEDIQFIDHIHDLKDQNPDRRKIFASSPYNLISTNLERAIIPKLPNMRHLTITGEIAERVKKEKGIDDIQVITDVFDFDLQPHPIDPREFRDRFGIGENDLIFGLTSRIIPRKGIQLGIQFVRRLMERRSELVNVPGGIGPHNINFDENSRVVLLLFNDEDRQDKLNQEYFAQMEQYARELDVDMRDLGQWVVADSRYDSSDPESISFYSTNTLYDGYLFPSLHESNGNNLIEEVAMAPGVVPVVLENHAYQLVMKDAIPNIVSLGVNGELEFTETGTMILSQENLEKAVDRQIYLLRNPGIAEELANQNREKAREKFGIENNIGNFLPYYLPDKSEIPQ